MIVITHAAFAHRWLPSLGLQSQQLKEKKTKVIAYRPRDVRNVLQLQNYKGGKI